MEDGSIGTFPMGLGNPLKFSIHPPLQVSEHTFEEIVEKAEKAVVEGIGDHGCEYMTGGIAVILGEVGRNFGAGMSGGIAYVYDNNNKFNIRCNSEGLNLDPVSIPKDVAELRSLIVNHYNATQSPLAQRILENWQSELSKFIKVLPEEYRQALIRLEKENLVKQ